MHCGPSTEDRALSAVALARLEGIAQWPLANLLLAQRARLQALIGGHTRYGPGSMMA